MAKISIKGMEFYAYHGCFDEETIIGTNFLVDIQMEVSTKKAQYSDKLNDTVDYQSVYRTIKKEMQKSSKLLEHICQRILNAILKDFPEVKEAEIRLQKLNPPLGGKMQSVAVELKSTDL